MALKIARSIPEVPSNWDHPVGFVPTMGAFHEGHLSLMRKAKEKCGFCAISIFVNPTQFGPNEDFLKYPRQEELDLEMARSVGVDFAFIPSVEEMYGSAATRICVDGVSVRWEGASRPGHFDGVATVVAKLFHIVHPSHAFFGLKDFQQCAVIRQMVQDLNFPVELSFEDTVREPDGLALSSRNRYLTGEERKLAPHFYRSLREAAVELKSVGANTLVVKDTIAKYARSLAQSGFEIDYFAAVDANSLEPLTQITGAGRMIGAVKLGSTRLIDNCAI